jgi:hypothetical protein
MTDRIAWHPRLPDAGIDLAVAGLRPVVSWLIGQRAGQHDVY